MQQQLILPFALLRMQQLHHLKLAQVRDVRSTAHVLIYSLDVYHPYIALVVFRQTANAARLQIKKKLVVESASTLD